MQNFKYSEFAYTFPGDVFEVRTSYAKRNNRSRFYSLEEALENAVPTDHYISISAVNSKIQAQEFNGCPVKDILKYIDRTEYRCYIFTEDKCRLFNIYMEFDEGDFIGIDLDILTQSVDFNTLFGSNYYYLPEWDTTTLSERILDCYDYDQLLNHKVYGLSIQPSLWIWNKKIRAYNEFNPYVSYSNMVLNRNARKKHLENRFL